LALCGRCSDEQLAQCRTSAGLFAEKGYRCLAVAIQADGGDFELAGLAALHDPPRADSREVIEALKSLGVRVMMLTGDALPVAKELARRLGLGEKLRSLKRGSGPQAGISDLETLDGLAEIYPEDKFLIVRQLQEKKHVVGMTGDGVNDAPALKQAEVGVAVSNATDAAKAAAGVVLTAEGLSALPDLIKIGRSIHQRMETWILNKVIKTFQIVAFVVAAFLATGQFVVTTFDMVLLLFLIDFVTLALATDRAQGSALPVRWEVDRLVKQGFQLGVAAVLESAGLLWIGWERFGLGSDAERLHSFGFEILFYFSLFTVLVVRERGPFWSSAPSAPLAWALGLDAMLVAALVGYGFPGLAPLPFEVTLLVIGYAGFFSLFVNDRIKLSAIQRQGNAWGGPGVASLRADR
jgi:H+-transporting ATPase